jgi:hypothetical protein
MPHRLRPQHDRQLVDLNGLLGPRHVEVHHRAVVRVRAGVVHQHVHRAEGVHGRLDTGLGLLGLADMRRLGQELGLRVRLPQFPGDGVERLLPAGGEHDVASLCGQCRRRGLADPARRSCDQRRTPFKPCTHLPYPFG